MNDEDEYKPVDFYSPGEDDQELPPPKAQAKLQRVLLVGQGGASAARARLIAECLRQGIEVVDGDDPATGGRKFEAMVIDQTPLCVQPEPCQPAYDCVEDTYRENNKWQNRIDRNKLERHQRARAKQFAKYNKKRK